ncbi:hypothetical protein Tco_1136266 [Tanacetum coccineum]
MNTAGSLANQTANELGISSMSISSSEGSRQDVFFLEPSIGDEPDLGPVSTVQHSATGAAPVTQIDKKFPLAGRWKAWQVLGKNFREMYTDTSQAGSYSPWPVATFLAVSAFLVYNRTHDGLKVTLGTVEVWLFPEHPVTQPMASSWNRCCMAISTFGP